MQSAVLRILTLMASGCGQSKAPSSVRKPDRVKFFIAYSRKELYSAEVCERVSSHVSLPMKMLPNPPWLSSSENASGEPFKLVGLLIHEYCEVMMVCYSSVGTIWEEVM